MSDTKSSWKCYIPVEEEKLIRRVQAGDDAAVVEIYENLCVRAYVMGYLRNNYGYLKPTETVHEDVFTDAVLDFKDWVRLPTFSIKAGLSTLLTTCAKNRAIKHWIKQSKDNIDFKAPEDMGNFFEILIEEVTIKISKSQTVSKEDCKKVLCEKLSIMDDDNKKEMVKEDICPCSHNTITHLLKTQTQTSCKICCLLLKDWYKIYCPEELEQMTEAEIREVIERERLKDGEWGKILIYKDKTGKILSDNPDFIRKKRNQCVGRLRDLIKKHYNIP